ncbi:MAG: SDR family oxidoreductase [Clostridia bacterium]|nr:SDR family oxidoreductase [Clostridia bacterium]
MKRLEGKTAIITGCNRGIGRAIMNRFMQEGANIIACSRNISPELEAYYEASQNHYCINIYPIKLDLSDEENIKVAMKKVQSLKQTIDVLVNNAGISSGGLMLMTSISELKKVFQINYFAQVQVTQYVAKMMMRQNRGSIILMSSVLGQDSRPGATSYGASKAALELFAKTVSKELGTFNIRVNAIAPNLVDTDMAHKMEQKLFENLIKSTSLGRMANPEEIANLALFLASNESSYVTGQTIRVDGGL